MIAEKTIESSYHDNNMMSFRDSPANKSTMRELKGINVLKSTKMPKRSEDVRNSRDNSIEQLKRVRSKKSNLIKKTSDEV